MRTQPQQPLARVDALAHWRCVDCVSDLHLHAAAPATWHAFARYLQGSPAQALFLLGDIFEAWVGDDVLGSAQYNAAFEREVLQHLRRASARMALYFMPGNRDFLLGSRACAQAGMTLLADPCVLALPQGLPCTLLSHGDALCLGDVPYQRLRAQVRSSAWQRDFLSQSLPQRLEIARQMRAASRHYQQSATQHADVDARLAQQWLGAHACTTLLHGHTHRPGRHSLSAGHLRVVLSDWDASAARGDVLRLRLPQARWRRVRSIC